MQGGAGASGRIRRRGGAGALPRRRDTRAARHGRTHPVLQPNRADQRQAPDNRARDAEAPVLRLHRGERSSRDAHGQDRRLPDGLHTGARPDIRQARHREVDTRAEGQVLHKAGHPQVLPEHRPRRAPRHARARREERGPALPRRRPPRPVSARPEHRLVPKPILGQLLRLARVPLRAGAPAQDAREQAHWRGDGQAPR